MGGGDAGRLKDALVVDDALGVAGGGDAVDLAVEGAVGGKVVVLLDGGQVAHGVEVVAQLGQGDGGGDHADIAPLLRGQTGGHVAGVVGDPFVLDGDVGVQLLELGHIAVEGAVLDQVGAVVDDLDGGGQVGVVGADGQLVVRGQVAGSGLGAGVRAPAPICLRVWYSI